MALKIASWNMQGGGIYKFVNSCSADYGFQEPDVLFVQESGVPGTTGFSVGMRYQFFNRVFYCKVSRVHTTKTNLRCTVSILVDEQNNNWMSASVNTFQYAAERDVPFIVDKSGVLLATMHAPANEDRNFVLDYLRTLIKYTNNDCNRSRWIMMGDMNISPHDLFESIAGLRPNTCNLINMGSISRPNNIGVLFPGSPTHRNSGKVLDYAFIGSGLIDRRIEGVFNWRIYSSPFHGSSSVLSDHNMIGLAAYSSLE